MFFTYSYIFHIFKCMLQIFITRQDIDSIHSLTCLPRTSPSEVFSDLWSQVGLHTEIVGSSIRDLMVRHRILKLSLLVQSNVTSSQNLRKITLSGEIYDFRRSLSLEEEWTLAEGAVASTWGPIRQAKTTVIVRHSCQMNLFYINKLNSIYRPQFRCWAIIEYTNAGLQCAWRVLPLFDRCKQREQFGTSLGQELVPHPQHSWPTLWERLCFTKKLVKRSSRHSFPTARVQWTQWQVGGPRHLSSCGV